MSVYLSVRRYLHLSVCLYSYVSICVLSNVFVCRSVCRLSVWRLACVFLFLSVSLSISVCLAVCVPLSIQIRQSVNQSVSLSVRCQSVGQSSVFLNCQSVTVRTKRAGSGGEDAESESAKGYAHKSNRLRTQERQIGLMNVELRTEAESRGLRARS